MKIEKVEMIARHCKGKAVSSAVFKVYKDKEEEYYFSVGLYKEGTKPIDGTRYIARWVKTQERFILIVD